MTTQSKNSEQMNKIVHAAAQLFARQGYHWHRRCCLQIRLPLKNLSRDWLSV